MGYEASILLDYHRKNECVLCVWAVAVNRCTVLVPSKDAQTRGKWTSTLFCSSSLQVHTMKPLKNAVPQRRALEDSSEQVGREREREERGSELL